MKRILDLLQRRPGSEEFNLAEKLRARASRTLKVYKASRWTQTCIRLASSKWDLLKGWVKKRLLVHCLVMSELKRHNGCKTDFLPELGFPEIFFKTFGFDLTYTCLVRKQISQLPMSPLFWRLYELSTHFLSQTFFVRQKHISIVRVWTPEEGFWQQWLLRANRRRQTHRHNLYPTTRKLNSSYCCSSLSPKTQMAISWLVIFGTVYFLCNISEMKRAIRAPLMAKRPDFQCCFGFYKEVRRCNGKLTFVIFPLFFLKTIVLCWWLFSSYDFLVFRMMMIVLCWWLICFHLMMMIIVMLMIVLFTISGAAKWLNEGEIGQICKR